MRFIVVGAGDVGISLSKRLAHYGHDVVLIERQQEKLDRVADTDLQFIAGNGCSPDFLIRAGIASADYLVAVTDNDEVNVTSCLVSKLVSPHTKRICRIRDLNLLENKNISEDALGEYFNLIINPAQAAADYLFQLFQVPGAKEIVEFEGGKIRVVGLSVSSHSPVLNRKLDTLKDIREKYPILILAIMRGSRLIVPRGSDKIRAGDIIYSITTSETVPFLFELAGKSFREGKKVMIWGGTPVGRSLAHALEERGIEVKLIVSDGELARELADKFSSTLVLHGHGTDHNLLIEENVSEVDSFISVTSEEEENILSALLAKRLGAPSAMALVNRGLYKQLVSTIGVDAVVSVRIAAASAIFKHIHPGYMVSEFSIRHQGAGFVEMTAESDFSLINQPIKNLHIPHGMLIACIIRGGRIIMPGGEDKVMEGDKVIIFVTDTARRQGEKILKVNLELIT